MLAQKLGANKVYYGQCEYGEILSPCHLRIHNKQVMGMEWSNKPFPSVYYSFTFLSIEKAFAKLRPFFLQYDD